MTAASSTNVATLIGADRLSHGTLSEAADRLREAGLEPLEPEWLDADHAADIGFEGLPDNARLALQPMQTAADIAIQAAGAQQPQQSLVER